MLIIKNLTYKINHIETIFENLSFSLNDNKKIAIIGKNGIGKSILLQLITGKLKAYSGEIIKNDINIAYFPQKFNESNFNTVADVFGLEKQIISLQKVENNEADIEDYAILDNNWNCLDIIKEKMNFFGLNFDPMRDFDTLSGGEKVKLILSSIINKNSNFLILDEPTNNMDYESKKYFYNFIKTWKNSILLVSHDRELLNLVDKIFELRKIGMKDTKLFIYTGNFDCYIQQKEIEEKALENSYENTIKKINQQKSQLQKDKELTVKKRKEGEKGEEKHKYPKKGYGLMKMAAETKRGAIAIQDSKRVEKTEKNISEFQAKIEVKQDIYFKFSNNKFSNKILIDIENLYFYYGSKQIFNDFNLLVNGNEKIAIEGRNGSGKTTLFKIINGKLNDFKGKVRINTENIAYLDQECGFFQNDKTILENMILFNDFLNEKSCRNILAEFLFRTDAVFKKIEDLSGGEKLRVALACILSKQNTPEILLLDEPTNNMDLDSIKILEQILNQYNGTIIVISHDKLFK